MKCIAFTFDDGPSLATNRLLDILAQRGVKATFFPLGHRADAFASILSRAASEGHEVGSHSWIHKNLVTLSLEEIRADLGSAKSAIERHTGKRIRYFRPPYGSVNDNVRNIIAADGQSIASWNVDPEDWRTGRDAASICDHIVSRARPGAIILLHDIYEASVDATECAIDRLSADYRFVTMSALDGH